MKWAPQGAFARSVTMLAGSTVFAQALAVLSMPVLSRLYRPADFGVLGLFSSTLSLLLVVASLRYEQALPLPEEEGDAAHLMALAFLCLALITLLLTAAILVGGQRLAAALQLPALGPYLWLLPIALLGSGGYQVLNYWAIRRKTFSHVAQTRLVQSVGQVGLQVGLGLTALGALGLVLGDAVGRVLGTLRLSRGVDWRALGSGLTGAGILEQGKRFHRFPTVMLASTLLNVGAVQLPFLVIPGAFGTTAAGMFFLAYRVLVLPMAVVGSAVGQVFYGEVARLGERPEELQRLCRQLTAALLSLNIPLYGVIAIAGVPLFKLAFGASWGEAGLYAQVLAPMVMLWAVASPISSILVVAERFAENLLFTALELGLKVAAIYAGIQSGSVFVTAAAIGAAGVLLYLLGLWRFLRLCRLSLFGLVGPTLRITALSSPLFAIAAMTTLELPWPVRLGVALLAAPFAALGLKTLWREARAHD